MTEKVETEKKKSEQNTKPKSAWSIEEKKTISTYGCQLLTENATKDQVEDKKVPSDAMIVTYKTEEKVHQDLCRGSKVNIFDLYYDKFGKDSVVSIDWGHGTVHPHIWGYKAPEKKRRRKS
tara:strand:- start:1761 stop:2123 length:363 start_codon:yes stop_codon:yes gene_type:complete